MTIVVVAEILEEEEVAIVLVEALLEALLVEDLGNIVFIIKLNYLILEVIQYLQ